MRGRIITSDHRIFELPVLLRWNITYTGGVPCDSYEVTCVYDRTMAELLHLAAGFLALDENGGVLLRGVVDEYEVKLTAAGLTVTICGRGYAARLLDNESRPVTYQGATLAEIGPVPCGALRHFQRGDRAGCRRTLFTPWPPAPVSGRRWRVSAGPMGAFRPASGGTGCWWRRRSGTTGGGSSSTGPADPLLHPAGGPLRCADGGAGHRQDPERVLQRAEPGHAGPGRPVPPGGLHPGQSTWAAMRYTGEYQIRQSREEELTIELGLAGVFPGVSRGHGPAGTGGHGPLRRVPGGRGGKHGLPGDGRGLYIDTEGADMRCGYRDR